MGYEMIERVNWWHMADVTAAMANIKHQLNDCKNVISIQSEVSLSVVIWWEVVDTLLIASHYITAQ